MTVTTRTLRRLTNKVKDESYGQKVKEAGGDPKKMWRVINSIYRGKQSKTSLCSTTIGLDVDVINDHFATIGPETVRKSGAAPSPTKELPRRSGHFLREFRTPDMTTLVKVLGSMKGGKAARLPMQATSSDA